MGSARDDRGGAILVMAERPERELDCTKGPRRVPPLTAAEPGELEHLAQRLTASSAHRPDLARRAERLADRIATQRFHIAVLGEFKRGKSTLVNALIGQPLLPSGVVPLTTVATEVHFGSEQTTVVFADGRRRIVAPDVLGDYVTEQGNPSNIKHVERVEVAVDTVFGAPGLVLVDTPGIASVNQHNTTAAHDALLDSDAAVLVLSADSPLSHDELAILADLRERRAKVFIVINKADHLTGPELDQVRAFVADHLRHTFDEKIEPYCVSARSALDGGRSDAAQGFEAFRGALMRFVRGDLVAARRASAIAELERLGQGLDQTLQIEAAAETMDALVLSTQLQRFESAARDGRRQLEEDRIILDHDVAVLAADVGQRLSERAAAQAQAVRSSLAPKAISLPRRQLDTGLRDAIEDCVRQRFDPIRREVQGELEGAWEVVAARFAGRVQARIDDLINVANQLFDVHLPKVTVPAVAEQQERFSYLFLHIEGSNAIVGRLLGSLVPSGIARRRASRLADRRLFDEFEKHAGRARHDLAERVAVTKRQLVAAMFAEFDRTEASLLAAAESARTLLSLTEEERKERDFARGDLRALVADVARVVALSSDTS